MRNRPSPAVLVLLGAGIESKALAAALDITPQAVSLQLAGRTSPKAAGPLLELIEAEHGAQLAERVAEAIEEAASRHELARAAE